MARPLFALLVLAAAAFTLKLYIVQELIAGLLFVAIAVTTVLALTVAFVLCQEGILRILLWARNAFAPLSRIAPHQNGSQDPIVSGPDYSIERREQ